MMAASAMPAATGTIGAPAFSSSPATRMQEPMKNFQFMANELNANS
jgi:hypothetical protein